MKNFLFVLAAILFAVLPSFSATRTSTGNGLWTATTSWSGGAVPTCGDSVVIQAGHTISVTSQQDYTGCGSQIALVIYGKIYFTNGNKLRLPCNSRIYLMTGGTVDSDGNGASNQIEICNVTYWTSKMGAIFGPRCFPATACGTVIPTVCGYGYRKRITIDPTRVAGNADLENFPVLINITADADLEVTGSGGHVANANGYDITFTDADGVSPLTFQLERYVSTTGRLTAWVKVPVLYTAKNTYIYMYYGNSSITTDLSSNSVWSDYHGAWHFQANSLTDNSLNAENFTSTSTSSTTNGFINDGRSSTGNGFLELSSFPDMSSSFAISAWVRTADNTVTGQRIFCDDVNNTQGYALSIADGGTGRLRFFSRGVTPVILDGPASSIADNTWYHVAAVADLTAKTRTLYLNGVAIANDTYTGAWGTDAGNCSAMGETAGGETANRLEGRLDELHVAKSALSADWILTEYNNQSSPSTFYSISAEPKVWTGGTSTAWATTSNWLGGSTPVSGNDVIINNGTNQPTMSASLQANSLFIRTNATLSLASNSLFIRTDVANCGVLAGGTGFVSMNGGTSTAPTQYLSGPGTYSLYNFSVNNTYSTSPEVFLNTPVSVYNALTLTSGILTTNTTNILALQTAATSGAGSASSYVNGPMTKTGNTAFVFPVGRSGTWARLGMSAPTATATFRGEYFRSAFTSSLPVNTPLVEVSRIEYWMLDRLAGTGNTRVSLYFENAGTSGINDCPDLTVARWNGASWDEHVATATGTCTGTGAGVVTTTANITSFSPFTFGSKISGTLNPLPVEMVSFNLVCEGPHARLKWVTASESNNDFFRIERTVDGEVWEEAGRVPGAGTSAVTHEYSYLVEENDDNIFYYRIAQVDKGGRSTVFRTVMSSCEPEREELMTVYPNPAADNVNVGMDLSRMYGEGMLRIMDNMGRIAFERNVKLPKGGSVFSLSLDLPPGVYNVMLVSANVALPVRKLVIH